LLTHIKHCFSGITGNQFLDITHKAAVKALKKSRHMMLTLKYVGKLPHAKMTVSSSGYGVSYCLQTFTAS